MSCLELASLILPAFASATPRSTILIAENDQDQRDLLASTLSGLGYDLVFVLDGYEAIALAQAELPKLILIAMDLPRLNGSVAARYIKVGSAMRHTPLLALSRAHHVERTLGAGCDGVLGRPLEAAAVAAHVLEYVWSPE